MDENRNNNDYNKDEEYLPDNSESEDTEGYDDDEPYEDLDLNFEKTQEMDSMRPRASDDEEHGITPRDEFTDLNSADDMSRTLMMDSLGGGEDDYDYDDEPAYAQNPVKRRRKKNSKINHTKTMGQIFLGAVISVTALGLGIFFAIKVIGAMRDITGMAKTPKEIDFEITENMSVDDIIDGLYENGIIDMPKLMKMYVKFTDNTTGYLNGPHTVNSGMSYNNIIASLQRAKEFTKTTTVVIPEGLSVVEVGNLLEENLVCRAVDFEEYVKSKQNRYDFEDGLIVNPDRMFMLEGYLFPDTYEFYVVDYLEKNPNYDTRTWAKDAADKMLENFEDHITKKLKARMKEMDMTLDETIILASIIQREGNTEESMAMVSSVFHNRLNDPENYPNLGSDVTYDYINQTIKPLTTAANREQMEKIEKAYDTYQCFGLPAGAICNPGIDAINAALNPDTTPYYYFIADREGNFYWAETLEQHEQNIIDADLHYEDESGESTAE